MDDLIPPIPPNTKVMCMSEEQFNAFVQLQENSDLRKAFCTHHTMQNPSGKLFTKIYHEMQANLGIKGHLGNPLPTLPPNAEAVILSDEEFLQFLQMRPNPSLAKALYTDLTKQKTDETEEKIKARLDYKDDHEKILDKMCFGDPGGETWFSRLQRESPFLLENSSHFTNVLMEKGLAKLFKGHLCSITEDRFFTIDEWNQKEATLLEDVFSTFDDPELESFSSMLSLNGFEMFATGSFQERTATSFKGHPSVGGTDVDLMICNSLELPARPVDIKGRPGYLNLYLGNTCRYRRDENNFMYSTTFQMSILHGIQHGDSLKENLSIRSDLCPDITGPAIGVTSSDAQLGKEYDLVIEFYRADRKWPPIAEEWLTRRRPSGWPSPSLIDKARSYGTYMVPVAHPLSDNPDIEWRYSFSKQELDLMHSVTDTQRKCFMLTKRYCNLMFEHYKLVSSYYVKTAFFWLLEELPPHGWVQMTMWELVDFLLNKLVIYFVERRLPHFFIRQANIIDHLSEEAMRVCVQKLEHIRRGVIPKYIKEDFCLNAIWETVPPCDEDVAKTSKYRVFIEGKKIPDPDSVTDKHVPRFVKISINEFLNDKQFQEFLKDKQFQEFLKQFKQA